MIDKNFWKDRKVFLTGHTGFKGSWMLIWLQELGCDICGYALEPEKIVFLIIYSIKKKNLRIFMEI